MYLNVHNMYDYLIRKKIINNHDIVNGNWTISFSNKIHHVCFVTDNNIGKGYVVKQPHQNDNHHINLLDREFNLFQISNTTEYFSSLKQVLPQYILYDHSVPALVMEFIPHDNGLDAIRRENSNPSDIGKTLAIAFANAHIKILPNSSPNQILNKTIPWILQLFQVSEENIKGENFYDLFIKIKNDPVFSHNLSDTLLTWDYTTLIHIDSKMDNVLIDINHGNKAWIIDWALSGIGDPAWDIGNVMHSALMLWFLSISFNKEEEMSESAKSSPFPLEKIQEFTRSFFRAYTKQTNMNVNDVEIFKLKVIKYLAIALIQHILSDIKFGAPLYQRHLAVLDTAHSILSNPTDTISEFL